MEHTIESPNTLNAVTGSAAWLRDYLQRAHLFVGTSQRGNIALLCTTEEKDVQGAIVAVYAPNANGTDIPIVMQHHGNGFYACYPAKGRNEELQTFFGPLTPAAWKIADNWIDQCVVALAELVNGDSADFSISVTVKKVN